MGNKHIFDSSIPHPPFTGGLPEELIENIEFIKEYNIRHFSELFREDKMTCDTILVPKAGHTFLHEVVVR